MRNFNKMFLIFVFCILLENLTEGEDLSENFNNDKIFKDEIGELAKKDSDFSELIVSKSQSDFLSKIKKDALFWIKTVIKPEWIPENINDILTAEKDVKKFESIKNNMVICRLEGDYILAKYEIKGHKIIIQESGVSISIRIEKTTVSSQNASPENLIKENLTTYLNIPSNAKFLYKLVSGKKIVFGTAIDEKISAHKNEWDWWWQHLSICISKNNSLFFVYIYERNGTTEAGQASPGYPDRF